MTLTLLAPRIPPPTERVEQRRCIALFKAAGCVVYSTSQYRASRVAVGLPDLKVFHEGQRDAFWFETKRYEPKRYELNDRSTWIPMPLRPDQETFRRLAGWCGELHYWGGIAEAQGALVDLRLGEYREHGVFWLTRAGAGVFAP